MKSLPLFVGILVCAAAAMAQETRASLSGIVSDASGSVIQGALLELTNLETGVVLPTNSNDAGLYRFLFLNPGMYKLVATVPGFKTFERGNIELTVNYAATLPVVLEVGSQAEKITVSAEAALLTESEKADHGLLIDNKKVVDLPINTRNPIMLAALANGIVHTSGTTLDQKPFSNSADGSWAINGGVASTVEFLLDGAPNNTIYNRVSTVALVPSVDAVQEFKVMTSTYDAQYGHTGGGAINISLKSGTNALHGSGYEYLKRGQFNAATFSDNAHGNATPASGLDQYGFTIGGPLYLPKLYHGKDKTFFFFAWEKYHEDQEYPSEKVASVPTPLQRQGDFSETRDNARRLITVYDPLTGHFDANNKWVRTAFAGNRIPASRMNPVGAKIAALYPLPNTTSAGSTDWQNNFFWGDNIANFNFQNVMLRVDHNFNSRERVYARWSWSDFVQVRNSNAVAGLGGNHRDGGKLGNGGVIDSVTTINPGTIFNMRAALSYWREKIGPPDFGFDATQWGWPASVVSQLPMRNLLPSLSIAGATTLGNAGSNITFEPTTVLSLQPNVALVRGKQAIKGGLDFRVTRYTQFRPDVDRGSFSFNEGFTRADYLTQDGVSGLGMASLLLGYAASGSAGFTANPFYQWVYTAPWIQDDIKLTRKLALNLGVRWDITSPVTERFNRMNRGFFADELNPVSSQTDQARFPGFKAYGGIGFGGVKGQPRSAFDSDLNNIQPRLGAAYQITPKTVLRGGWAIFYVAPTDTGVTSGFSQTTPFVATQDSGRTPFHTITDPFPTGLIQPVGSSLGLGTFVGQGLTFANPQSVNAYVHQFSFGLQRELPGKITLDASYVGSRTLAALSSKDTNAISIASLALGDTTKGGDPNYLNQQVPNPFQNLLPGTSINGPTVARSQLLRPFPVFSGITETNLNTGKIWYNSLQVSMQKHYSHGLTFSANYTLSKNIQATGYINAQDAQPTRTLTAYDRPQRFSFAPSYELPFGPGRRFLNSRNRMVSRLVGGWQVLVNTVLQSGAPMGIPGSVWILGDPHLDNAGWDRLFKTGYIDVTGVVRNVLPGEQPVFAVRPPNTLRTTPDRWGNLRDRWATTYDASAIKTTRIREGMTAQFRFEAFNALNTPVFSSDPNLTPTSTNFGKIIRDSGQSNAPRTVQFGFRFMF